MAVSRAAVDQRHLSNLLRSSASVRRDKSVPELLASEIGDAR